MQLLSECSKEAESKPSSEVSCDHCSRSDPAYDLRCEGCKARFRLLLRSKPNVYAETEADIAYETDAGGNHQ